MTDVRCEYGIALTWVAEAANDARDQLEHYVSQSMVQYVFWFLAEAVLAIEPQSQDPRLGTVEA